MSESSETNEASTVVPTSPYQTSATKINHSESHSVQITTIRLNGVNFLRWSQSVRMYVRGRGKMGCLTGDTKAPKTNDPNYALWDAENSMIMVSLVNSMNEDISANYMCYSKAKESGIVISKLGNKYYSYCTVTHEKY